MSKILIVVGCRRCDAEMRVAMPPDFDWLLTAALLILPHHPPLNHPCTPDPDEATVMNVPKGAHVCYIKGRESERRRA